MAETGVCGSVEPDMLCSGLAGFDWGFGEWGMVFHNWAAYFCVRYTGLSIEAKMVLHNPRLAMVFYPGDLLDWHWDPWR
jgi:hypothetical protein